MSELTTNVITGLVRFSYANVFEPKAAQEGAQEKYSVSILIPKKSKSMIKELENAIDAAVQQGESSGKFGGKDPNKNRNFKWPLRDGDEEREDDENYENMLFVNASSLTKPGIVDANRDEIIDTADFYSGCWGRASLNFYPFNTSGNMGIACGLNNLQKLKDDESLSGRRSASQDFDDDFADDYQDDDMLG